ncbi:MAG: hypothetical protein M3P33_00420 [bacterium]|nr:hypothetical protein [bacterium]
MNRLKALIIIVVGFGFACAVNAFYSIFLLVINNGTEFTASSSTFLSIYKLSQLLVTTIVLIGYIALVLYILSKKKYTNGLRKRPVVIPILYYLGCIFILVPAIIIIGMIIATFNFEKANKPIREKDKIEFAESKKITTLTSLAGIITQFHQKYKTFPKICTQARQIALVGQEKLCQTYYPPSSAISTEPFSITLQDKCDIPAWELLSETYITYNTINGSITYCKNDRSELKIKSSPNH